MFEPSASRKGGSAVILDEQDTTSVLRVFGDLSFCKAAEFESTIMSSASADKNLVIDFSECRYIDFTIVTALVRAHKVLGRAISVIVDPSSSIARLFKVFEVNTQLGVVTTPAI